MNVRKILGTLVCTLGLVVGATQAQAALLTDWNYTLSNPTIINVNTDFASSIDGGFAWTSHGYDNILKPKVPANPTGTLTLPAIAEGATSTSDSISRDYVGDHATQTSTPGGGITGTDSLFTELASIQFTYSATSVGGEVTLNKTYTLPLLYHYDANTGNEFVFYNADTVPSSGSDKTYDGYSYHLSGVGLFVDDRGLTSYTDSTGTSYNGWLINDDTRKYMYAEYILGGNNEASGTKAQEGLFELTGNITLTATNVPPAATPEPATMLLMGAGLVGLGLVARRRNSK